jgi:hypothetical protein
LVIVGNAQASSSVQIYVDGTSSGSACTANGSGAFSCSLGTVLAGTKSITAKATGANGESVASQALTIVVDRTAPTLTWAGNNYYIGPNATITLGLTISESTTTLTSSDFGYVCTMNGGCSISNFRGSGRNYSIDFTMINNTANGGVVYVSTGSYSDTAGNVSGVNPSDTIMYDMFGPTASFTRNGSSLTIDFGELVYGFDNEDLYFTKHGFSGSQDETYQGSAYNNLSQDPNNPNIWYCNLPPGIDLYYGVTTWSVEIGGSVTDADGFNAQSSWWEIPLLNIYNA